jgi:hypothetical protein
VVIKDGDTLIADLELSGQNQTVAVVTRINVATQQGSGGERLSSSGGLKPATERARLQRTVVAGRWDND